MTAAAREEFRRYLEASGLMDSITRVLSKIYDEHENGIDPMQYLKDHLGCPAGVDANKLRKENEELRNSIRALEQQIAQKTSS